MSRKRFLARGMVVVGLLLAFAGIAGAASGSGVTVRVEGLTKTLLAQTVVHTHSGWLTRDGAPTGKCPTASAAGALDAATKHGWVGKWDAGVGDYEITSIRGERHPFTSKDHWEIFVNDVSASKRACELSLRPGEQLLFAAVPDKGTEYPLAIQAPSSAKVGHAFNVTVVWYSAKGKPKPLAGATVSVAGHSGTTNSHGVIPLTGSHAGTFTLEAQHAGYIRAAPVTVHLS